MKKDHKKIMKFILMIKLLHIFLKVIIIFCIYKTILFNQKNNNLGFCPFAKTI